MESPLPIARPWTPPETEIESSPRSDYFSDPFRPPSSYASDVDNHWPGHPHALCDTPTERHNRSRPKLAGRVTEPTLYMPTTPLNFGGANANGALRYPYTPDSSRILRRSTELPSSPIPWDDYSEHSSSPVQSALSSCLAHFENLIQSQQPDEDQMEYIVGQFEAMTSYLSAPNAQTRMTDEHLFNEPEQSATGLGSADAQDLRTTKLDYISKEAHQAYVAEVGNYIEGVKGYIEDLKMRLDEVKTLNSIQLDVINGLRRQMRTVRHGMRRSLDMSDDFRQVEKELDKIGDFMGEEDNTPKGTDTQKEFGLDSWETLVDEENPTPRPVQGETSKETEKPAPKLRSQGPRRKIITIIRKPERRSFWTSFGQALDSFGDLLLDY